MKDFWARFATNGVINATMVDLYKQNFIGCVSLQREMKTYM